MNRIRSLAAVAVLTVSTAVAADPALLSLIPADVKGVGGMNVTATAASPFGQFVLSQMKADNAHFNKFILATGFDPRTHLREVIVAGSAVAAGNVVATRHGSALVAARGTFNGPQIYAAAKAEGATSFQYNGVEVLRGKGNDGGAVAVLDASLAIAGDEAMVKRAIDQRGGPLVLDPKLAAKANDLSSRFDAWAVSYGPVAALAGAAQNYQPNNPLNNTALQTIEQTSGGVKFGNIIQFSGEAVTRTEKDALALVDVMRFVLGMMQLQREKNAEIGKFAGLFDSLEIKANAATVQVSLSVPQADLEQLVKSKRTSRRASISVK
jgi:hypothetical protein